MSEIIKKIDKAKIVEVSDTDIVSLKKQYDLFRKLQQDVLEQEIDYGFPGGRHQGQKPSLYKSGAEKLTRLFNLIPRFEIIKEAETDKFILYMFKCVLETRDGLVIGEGFGSANSREKSQWNANPWANANSILKIAKKRAHVDAVLTGLGASNVFTQDLEDMTEQDKPQAQSQTQAQSQPVQQKNNVNNTEKNNLATAKQNKLIHALIARIAKETDTTPDVYAEEVKKTLGYDSLSKLTKKQASDIISYLKGVEENLHDTTEPMTPEEFEKMQEKFFGD